jgi:hypothetical protein
VVLVTTPDDTFRKLTVSDFLRDRNQVTVIDFWRCLSESFADAPGIHYVPIGRCLDDESAADTVRSLWAKTVGT